MVAIVRCPHCSGSFEVPDSFLGQEMTCLTCSRQFHAPKKSELPPAAPQSPPPTPRPPPPTPPTARPRSTPAPPQPRRVQRPPRRSPAPQPSGTSAAPALGIVLALLLIGGLVIGVACFFAFADRNEPTKAKTQPLPKFGPPPFKK